MKGTEKGIIMIKFKKILLPREFSEKYPFLEEVLTKSYQAEIVKGKFLREFTKECIDSGECFAIINVSDSFSNLFKEVKSLVRRLEGKISSFCLINVNFSDDDVGFEPTVLSFDEANIAVIGRNEFFVKYSEKEVKTVHLVSAK